MRSYICLIAMYCYAVQASHQGHNNEHVQLVGVPDERSYGKLVYPKLELHDLGEHSHGELPPKEIKVIRTIKITVPQPYPVKVPHKVPYPVHVVKPYPVHVTKLVEVPHPVPVEVVKNVPVPVEVPKPYPVPAHEYESNHGSGGRSSYGGGFQPSGASGNGNYNNYNSYQSSGQYETNEGYGARSDQSPEYATVVVSGAQGHGQQENQGQQEEQQQQQQQQQGYESQEQSH